MTNRLAVLLALALSGCATPEPDRISYPDIPAYELRRATQIEVEAECNRVAFYAKAKSCTPGVPCFWDPNTREMWVAWGETQCIPHENGHAAGWTEAEITAKGL